MCQGLIFYLHIILIFIKYLFYFRIDELLQELTCFILRDFLQDSSLSSQIETSSIISSPIGRYSSCSDRNTRDCGVMSHLSNLLSSYDTFLTNYQMEIRYIEFNQLPSLELMHNTFLLSKPKADDTQRWGCSIIFVVIIHWMSLVNCQFFVHRNFYLFLELKRKKKKVKSEIMENSASKRC